MNLLFGEYQTSFLYIFLNMILQNNLLYFCQNLKLYQKRIVVWEARKSVEYNLLCYSANDSMCFILLE